MGINEPERCGKRYLSTEIEFKLNGMKEVKRERNKVRGHKNRTLRRRTGFVGGDLDRLNAT